MKSSYELAMERMGDGDKPLNEEQKAKIAEIDSKYKAKIAERKIFLEKSVQDALAKGSHEEAEGGVHLLARFYECFDGLKVWIGSLVQVLERES